MKCAEVTAVLFDLDGTVLHSMPVALEAINTVLQFFGAEAVTLKHFQATFYMPFEKWYRDQGIMAPFEDVLAYWEQVYDHSVSKLFPGAAETLHRLARLGLTLGIISGSDMEIVAYHVRANGLDGVLAYFHGGDGPKVGRMLEFCERFGHSPESVLYVGDTASDMRYACEAGLVPVGIAHGCPEAQGILREAGAAYIIDTLTELLDIGCIRDCSDVVQRA